MNNLKNWRSLHKITQKQLSDLLGITRSQVANIESGKNRLTLELASKLANNSFDIISLCGSDIYKEDPNEVEKLGYNLKVVKRRKGKDAKKRN